MFASRRLLGLLALVAFAGATACTTYRDELARGQRAFEQSDHDRTLALLRDLEPDVRRLSTPEQAQYAYLRGMTDYRVGYKADARHWLSVTKAYEDNSPGVLPADWKARATEALDELNGVVYTQGIVGLSTTRRSDDELKKEDTGKSDGAAKQPSIEPKKDEKKDGAPSPAPPPSASGASPPVP